VRTFDGDSFEVRLNDRREEVRLIGINTPEAFECHGDRAREALDDLLARGAMTLITGDEDRDRFGRLLRYVDVGGRDVGAARVSGGHAVTLQGDHPRDGSYLELAEQAWTDRRGMWAPDACGPPAAEQVAIAEVRYDPPGRDTTNAEEEWVEIRPEGEAPVDLSGWTLRDESSQHRFVFPELIVQPGESVRVRSGCGASTGNDLYWCADDPVWSNGGDTAILQDANGNVVDRWTYAGDY
jgi:micrococcal nuclease